MGDTPKQHLGNREREFYSEVAKNLFSLPSPSDFFSGQNWGTGQVSSPLIFLKGSPHCLLCCGDLQVAGVTSRPGKGQKDKDHTEQSFVQVNRMVPGLDSHLGSSGSCREVGGSLFSSLRREDWLLRPREKQSHHRVTCAPRPSSPALGGLGGAIQPGGEKLKVRLGLRMGMRVKAGTETELRRSRSIRNGPGRESGTGARGGHRENRNSQIAIMDYPGFYHFKIESPTSKEIFSSLANWGS